MLPPPYSNHEMYLSYPFPGMKYKISKKSNLFILLNIKRLSAEFSFQFLLLSVKTCDNLILFSNQIGSLLSMILSLLISN